MAATIYDEAGVINILQGASFLGGGGGGALSLGLQMIDTLKADGFSIEATVIPVEDANMGEYYATVAGLGAPSNVVMSKFEQDLPGAFAALKEAYRVQEQALSGIYSGEMGGLNTMVPIMLHIVSSPTLAERIVLLDADANGRAVPELNTCLVTAKGFPPTPVGIEGHDVNSQEIEHRYVAWTNKEGSSTSDDIAKRSESIARSIAIEYGQVGFSTWALMSNDLFYNACIGYLGLSCQIGNALDVGTAWDATKLENIKSLLSGNARQWCDGTVQSFTRDTSGGFDVGRTTIAGSDGQTYIIDFQNENIVAYTNNAAVITAPDRITILDALTCTPLTNVEADISAGKQVVVILSAADSKWWDEAYQCWNPILDRVSYAGDYIDYNGNTHPRVTP